MDISSIYGLGYSPAVSLINTLYPTSSVGSLARLSGLLPTAGIQTSISGAGALFNAVETLQSAAQKLADAGKFDARMATSSSAKVATANAAAGTANGAYAVEVRQLAQAQTLATSTLASTLTPIGSGSATLSFKFASGETKQVSLSGNDNTLAGIASAINSAGIGVEAKVAAADTGYQLTLTGQTGSLNAFNVSVSGNVGVANLLTYSAGGITGPKLTASAQNAEGLINGNAFVSGTNFVSTATSGLSLSLASTGKTTVTVAPDSGLAKTVSDFAAAYNAVQSNLTALGADNSAMGLSAAYLRGRLASSLGSANSLAQAGITLNANGSLNFNEKIFSLNLAKSSNNIASVLGNAGLAGRISTEATGSLSPSNLLKLAIPSLDYSGSLSTTQNLAYSYLGQLGVMDRTGGNTNLSSEWLLYGLNNALGGNTGNTAGGSAFLQSLLAQQAMNASLLGSL